MYVIAAMWGWWLYAFGPSMVLLREEQGTSRTLASLHGTAMAVGALLAGFTGPVMVRRYGRRRLLAGGCAGMVLGIGVLALGPGYPATLLGALVVGTSGSIAFNMTTPVLAELHQEASPAAISEANAITASIGLLAPLALGLAVGLGWGWRAGALVSALLAAAGVAAVVRAGPARVWSVRPSRRSGGRAGFGSRFWWVWLVIVTAIGAEFATAFWAADLLITDQGVSPGRASAAVSALVAGMAAGRWAAVRLTGRWPTAQLMVVALVVAALGWFVFWSAPGWVTAVAGLALCGLGMAWHFPLGISLLMEASAGRTDAAASAASVGAGLASGSAPFVLGAAADRWGPHQAFTVVPVLLAVAVVSLWLSRRRPAVPPELARASTPAPG